MFWGLLSKEMSSESLKFSVHPPQNSGPVKYFAKLNGNHLLITNIFELHEYQVFGLMKMHNMSKVWFANIKFILLRWNKKHFLWVFKGFQLPKIVWDLNCAFSRHFSITRFDILIFSNVIQLHLEMNFGNWY